jgi:ectoine hydroxylase-related dioxygenase (phytanoyl-CoA dioxygenase family)
MSFDDAGIAFPIRVLDDSELAAVRAEYQRLVDANGGTLKHFDKAHHKFGWAYDLVLHPRIIDRVAEILGDDVVVWGSLILSKPPHDDGFVAWHQDGEYATFLGGAPAVSAWIALSDSTTESGCMRVIPGSHKTKLAHAERGDPKNMLSRGQEIAAEVDESQAVDVVLRAGEMSLHHVDIVHGSNPNRAPWWRTGFIVRYSTPKMLRATNPIVIARGQRAPHLETMEQRP